MALNAKCNFAIDQSSNKSLVPSECIRAAQLELQGWAATMVLYNITKLQIRPISNGAMILPEYVMVVRSQDDNTPKALKDLRPTIARNVMSNMFIMGVLELSLDPTPEEYDKQKQWWQNVTNPQPQPQLTAITPQNMPKIIPKVNIKGGPSKGKKGTKSK